MKHHFSLYSVFFLVSSVAIAAPVLSPGNPNYLGEGLTPTFGTLINFDDLASEVSNSPAGSIALSAAQYAARGVTTISNAGAQLNAAVFSQQSAPVYLTTGAADSYAGNITVTLAEVTNQIGIGILSDSITPVTLNALGAQGNVLASFQVLTSVAGNTPNNGYWSFHDSNWDVKGLQIVSGANLGVDDLEFAPVPEPARLTLMGAGVLLILFGIVRRRDARRSDQTRS